MCCPYYSGVWALVIGYGYHLVSFMPHNGIVLNLYGVFFLYLTCIINFGLSSYLTVASSE